MKAKTRLTTHSFSNIFISLTLVFIFSFSTWSCGKDDPKEPMKEEMEEEMEEEVGYNYPEGKIFFDFPPMDLDGAYFYEPMGFMGVFPQDHGGFIHFEYGVDEPTTPIYAMADGVVTELGASGGDLFMTVKYSTTISGKLGHVGRFANFILDQTEPVIEGSPLDVEIEVKSGQIIGYISPLSALDIGIHDLEVADSKSFCYPELAYFENLYAADIFDYYKDENPVKAEFLSKNVRALPPYGGKNDFDVKGTISGNWYIKDKFEGKDQATNYFAIGYDHIYAQRIALLDGLPAHDPDIANTYSHSWIKGNNPKPEEVNVAFGIVKYELIPKRHVIKNPDGTYELYALDTIDDQIPRGVLLMQMLEPETMQLEFIADKTAMEVDGFTGNQRIYVRKPDYE
ncbi:M23 family metallopeptidase [Kriegella aquimaris]|uniref:Uncharacterized protein n=1 Tax=Kriegella aquimaris TaxID=192904 RepID=A0A1G9I7P1_9FLAO|nr:hypothetical protein [Kriegella aquimaris]SDL20834.1 hypothetical protein SAMN04488514_10116 [Kriegella aquimaris]